MPDTLCPPSSKPAPETGWLLDDGALCVGATECGFRMICYTSDQALRFARKEDAENFKIALHGMGMPANIANKLTPRDHSWG